MNGICTCIFSKLLRQILKEQKDGEAFNDVNKVTKCILLNSQKHELHDEVVDDVIKQK